MTDGDDDWGPVERGGGGSAAPSPAPSRAPDSEPEPPAPQPPAAEPPAAEPPDPHPDESDTREPEPPTREPAPGGFGPVQRGRAAPVRLPRAKPDGTAPRRGTRRVGRALGIVVVALVAIAGLTGVALALYASAQITRIDVGGLSSASGSMNVLVVGNDSREGLTDEELAELGTEAVEGQRTDTIFLLSVSGGRAAMLAFPRDLYVTRCDGTQGRINAAYARGGPTCMAETVAQASGIPVTHYLEVNFLGFIKIVDAVGGVSLYFDEPFVDRPAGIDLPAGCHRLVGRQAIGYVRARTAGGDLGRIARQQRFIAELADEITRPSTLLNPVRLFSTAAAGGQSLNASHNFGLTALLRLARAGRGFAGGGLATYTVPATNASIGGASVLVPDDDAAEGLFARFRDGSVLRPEPEPDADAPEPGAGPAPDTPAPDTQAPDTQAPGASPVPSDC